MKRTVAIYARVSTEHEAQLSALDNQIQYYDNILAAHPDWELYERYIDEGITGTSTKKRKNFLRMMEDAENGKFDLIVTREVSRFARNTVDTLQETRKLRRIGIEVWFTEDNIWTMNDEDGELRLTIMATLAQNESKKTSLRVKAGQMVSFQNAIPYGNGNILGYDRIDHGEFVINEEQAKTVRMIYDMYLSGTGVKTICLELEKRGRLTSGNKAHWYPTGVCHILRNPFYCGTIVYRKQYVPDYLEQKKINNFGEVEQYVAEGKHKPIVTKDEFNKVQNLLNSRIKKTNKGKHIGVREPVSIWSKKLVCQCGNHFHRKIWHRYDNGVVMYAYQCYRSTRFGSVATRQNKGLSIEDTCTSPMIQEWKLWLMARHIFDNFWHEKKNVIRIANEILENNIMAERQKTGEDEISQLERKDKRLKDKLDTLLDMRLNAELTKEEYAEKKSAIGVEREDIGKQIEILKGNAETSTEQIEDKLKILKMALNKDFNPDTHELTDEIIDAFVDYIVVYDDYFEWHLKLTNDTVDCLVSGRANAPSMTFVDKSPTQDSSCTGSYSQRTLSESACFLGTFEISKDYMRKSVKLYYGSNRNFRFPEKLEFMLFLV